VSKFILAKGLEGEGCSCSKSTGLDGVFKKSSFQNFEFLNSAVAFHKQFLKLRILIQTTTKIVLDNINLPRK